MLSRSVVSGGEEVRAGRCCCRSGRPGCAWPAPCAPLRPRCRRSWQRSGPRADRPAEWATLTHRPPPPPSRRRPAQRCSAQRCQQRQKLPCFPKFPANHSRRRRSAQHKKQLSPASGRGTDSTQVKTAQHRSGLLLEIGQTGAQGSTTVALWPGKAFKQVSVGGAGVGAGAGAGAGAGVGAGAGAGVGAGAATGAGAGAATGAGAGCGSRCWCRCRLREPGLAFAPRQALALARERARAWTSCWRRPDPAGTAR